MDPSPVRSTTPPPVLPRWPVRLASLLLLIQISAIVSTFSYYMRRANVGPHLIEIEPTVANINALPLPVINALWFGITFLPIALVLVIVAIGFLFLRRGSWISAMILEGFTLFLCLSFYFSTDMRLIYPVMAYSIFIVLYLNSAGVRSIFRALDQPT